MGVNSIINPTAIDRDDQGSFYISENSRFDVRKLDENLIMHAFAGSTMQGNGPENVDRLVVDFRNVDDTSVGVNGEFLVTDSTVNCVRKIDANRKVTTIAGSSSSVQGYAGDGGLATNALLKTPYSADMTSNGDIYISDMG